MDDSPKGATAKKDKGRSSGKENASMTLILDTTERLMREEGYGAVSSRRVAKEAGIKAPLVHYYFKTTDDLFLAVFRRAVGEQFKKFEEDFAEQPDLEKLWTSYNSPERTALTVEFMALANHRKAVKDEIAEYTTRNRQRRAALIASLIDTDKVSKGTFSAEGLLVLLVGVARTLVTESGLGISAGHQDAEAMVKKLIERIAKK